VPLVATRQDFYQDIWDALKRSNRSLKRTVPQATCDSSRDLDITGSVYVPVGVKAQANYEKDGKDINFS
jgi:hypothetical protein